MIKQLWGQQFVVPHDITAADLLRYPEDGSQNEVYEGILVRETMTTVGHGNICQRIGGLLFMYGQQTGFQNTILQNVLFDFTLPGAAKPTILAPDVSIMRTVIPAYTTVTADRPLIAIEVVSPNQTIGEIEVKKDVYLPTGVEEVWIFDPHMDVVEIWDAQGMTSLGLAQTLTSVHLPGFAVGVGYLLHG